jgi:hypothetical protein
MLTALEQQLQQAKSFSPDLEKYAFARFPE